MLRLATVFSGIGAIEHALDRMNIEHKIVFACDNGDVKLEMPKIDIDIDAIESELKKLKKKIKSFNSDISDEESVDYAAQLDTMLVGVEDELNKLREKLKVNENDRATINDAVNEAESVLENALKISTASKKKKYKELLKLRNIKASDKAKLFFVLRVALTLDEALTNIDKQDKAAKKAAHFCLSEKYRPLVYICSPYSGTITKNVKRARKLCRFALDIGAIPLAPHLLYPQFMDDENPEERYLATHTINY